MKALIIGATRGIGLELTKQYLAEGWHVTATARLEADLPKLQALGAQPLKLDVALPSSVSGMEWMLDGMNFDLVIYVAGIISRLTATTPPTQAEFDVVMHTNVLGAMQLIPTLAPKVAAKQGKFVFISSGLGSIAGAESSYTWIYRVSKAALNMAVKSAKFDYPQATFAVLSPGWVRTDMGGPQGDIEVDESVRGLRKVIAGLQLSESGCFKSYTGKDVPW